MPNTPLAACFVLVALAGCAAQQQQIVQREDMLAAAGFAFQPANTPARAAALAKLPPHRFVARTTPKGQPIFVFADPSICGCLYVGDQAAYNTYQRLVYQKQLVADQQMAASMQQDAAMENAMDWAPWGVPFGPFVY